MTDERFTEIDKKIEANGWSYDADNKRFIVVRGDERGIVKWHSIITLIPDPSLGELLDAYADRRKRTGT
jgi:hypothetical protein